MKRFVFLFSIIVLSLQVKSQRMFPIPGRTSDTTSFQKKVDYSFSTGTSFFSSPGYASGSSFYIAPEFKLKLSPKFKVDAGIMLSQNRFNFSQPVNLAGNNSVVVKPGPSYEGTVYASGNYAVNSKLTFRGSVMKDFSPNGYQNTPWNNSFQMMSLSADYKLSEHVTLGAGVRLMQGNGYNPYVSQGRSIFSPFNSYSNLGE